jgi:hypothetical protein
MKPLTSRDWQRIYLALNYVGANFDDMVDAYSSSEYDLGTEEEFLKLRDRVQFETNEARKLALVFFEMFPKDRPKDNQFTPEMWESIECTFGNWLERLAEDPSSALSKTKWDGKVTQAYFKMIGLPLPYAKWQMIDAVKEYFNQ